MPKLGRKFTRIISLDNSRHFCYRHNVALPPHFALQDIPEDNGTNEKGI
ncbi:MAG: hypothetical protein ACRCUY_06680 [Thermoguttaceae bacterium]